MTRRFFRQVGIGELIPLTVSDFHLQGRIRSEKITSKDVGKTSVIYFQYLANSLPQRDVQRTRRFLGQLGELIPVTDLHSEDCIWEEIQCNVLY